MDAVAPPTADPKGIAAVLEEDDEFEEFPIEDWEEGTTGSKVEIEQWQADWDDDDNLDDEFSVQLRTELQRLSAEAGAATATVAGGSAIHIQS